MDAGNWITLGATIIAAASFIWGISSWRASYLGQKKIELAEEVFELTIRCAAHVTMIRDPVSREGEGSTRKRDASEREEESIILDRAFVAIERYEARSDDFFKLYALMPRFSFYFGTSARKPVDRFQSVTQQIRFASYRLREIWKKQGGHFRTQEAFEGHIKQMQAAEAVFWASYSENDPINPILDSILSDVDRTCRHAIDPRRNLWWAMKIGLQRLIAFLRVPPDIREKDHPDDQ